MPDVDPLIVWGLFTRMLGGVLLIAFTSLAGQVVPLAGHEGILPVARKLERIRRDLPGLGRFLWFPSLLWLASSDVALRVVVLLGAVASAAAIVGGPYAVWAIPVAFVCYLSLDVALRLDFPWDCVLFEAAFLGLFLAPTLPLPNLAAASTPDPAIAWAYRLLIFRVVFGFGKFKFVGATKDDASYLRGFLVNQPLPSRLAWHAHRLPLFMHKVGLVLLFVVEILVSPLVLLPNAWGLVAGAAIVGLMVVIQLSGNFGWFNVVVITLSVTLLDGSTPRALDIHSPTLAGAVVALHTLGAALYFPWNSYFAHSFTHWDVWRRVRPRFLTLGLAPYRALHKLRWLHSYGVFPPTAMPPVRFVATYEVTWDGQEWHELRHRFAPTTETSPPVSVAPHHHRYDQGLIYESFGTNGHSFVQCIAGSGVPYDPAISSDAECIAQRILEGRRLDDWLLAPGTLPARNDPPALVRMRLYMLEPTTLEERRATGRWWTRTMVGPHMLPVSRRDNFWDEWLPEPELWHWDWVIWKRRSTLGALMKHAERGAEPTPELIVSGTDGLDRRDVVEFWGAFLEALGPAAREWSRLDELVGELRARFGAPRLRRFHRVAGRLRAMLHARFEPVVFPGGRIASEFVPTSFQLHLLIDHVISSGREAFDAAYRAPESALVLARGITARSGMLLTGVFRFEQLVHEAQKIRLLDSMLVRQSGRAPDSPRGRQERAIEAIAKKLWGIAHLTPFLRERFADERFAPGQAERYPEFEILATGEIVRKRDDRANRAGP